ncbi:hypothetical protein, partial [Flammeovirga aprica]
LFTTNPDLKKGLIDLVFATNYYDKKYDFLPNSQSSIHPIISEELKSALEEAKIEGIEFYEYNKAGLDVPIIFS